MPPLAEHEVVEVMEEELGVPWEDVFACIDPVPIAAGTIGQVHRAQLEGGERVVVKVQRPTAQDEILRDLALLELFAEKVAGAMASAQVVDMPAVVRAPVQLAASGARLLARGRATSSGCARCSSRYPRLDVPGVYDDLSRPRGCS